jgi:hypothetical protein
MADDERSENGIRHNRVMKNAGSPPTNSYNTWLTFEAALTHWQNRYF